MNNAIVASQSNNRLVNKKKTVGRHGHHSVDEDFDDDEDYQDLVDHSNHEAEFLSSPLEEGRDAVSPSSASSFESVVVRGDARSATSDPVKSYQMRDEEKAHAHHAAPGGI